MRQFAFVLALLLVSSAGLHAQQPAPSAPDMKIFTTSAEVQGLIANAKAIRKPDQPLVSQPILHLTPYTASLEYRTGVAPSAIHEHEAELFYVIDGSATMVTGGKLTSEKRTNAENLSGMGIDGGDSREIAKGDFIIVPEGTPHWFSAIHQTLVLMSLHVPRPVPAAH